MAEDMLQDSSGSQKTSQDSGVIAGVQSSNSTGKSATVQNNQSNKKYDLGVLFVHGIGNQQKGDTFKAIYPSIRDEFNSSGRFKYRELSKISDESFEVIGEISDGKSTKKVIFRESNWNAESLNHANEINDKNILFIIKEWTVNMIIRYIPCGCALNKLFHRLYLCLNKIFYLFFGFINFLLMLLYFMGMKIVASRTHSFIFTMSTVALFLFLGNKLELLDFFHNSHRISLEDRGSILISILMLMSPIFIFFLLWAGWVEWSSSLKGKNLVSNLIISIKKIRWSDILSLAKKPLSIGLFIFLAMGVLYALFPEWTLAPLGVITSNIILFLCFEGKRVIMPLWNQINKSADYVRTGDEFNYLQAVEQDIKRLAKDSGKIIVVAHSMGEYLSYNSLKRNIVNMDCKEVQLIGVGGGLGLVSLMGSLRASNRFGKYSIIKSIFLSFGAASLVLIILGGYTISSWGLVFDFYRVLPLISGKQTWDFYMGSNIVNPFIPFETSSWVFNIIFHILFIFIFSVMGIFVEKTVGIDMVSNNNLKFFKYSHFLDPVGNFAGFYYGNIAEKTITPNGSFAHSVRSYFVADEAGKSAQQYISKYVYMRKRVVHHIASTVYEDPSILQGKTHSRLDSIIEMLSCFVALFFAMLSLKLNINTFLAFLPLVAVFNYLIVKIFSWLRVVAETTRESPVVSAGKMDKILSLIVWFITCSLINFLIDIEIIVSIDNILSINV